MVPRGTEVPEEEEEEGKEICYTCSYFSSDVWNQTFEHVFGDVKFARDIAKELSLRLNNEVLKVPK